MPATTSPNEHRARRRQAGRRRRPRRRLRRGRPRRRPGRPAAARLAVRHPQLRRRRPAADGDRLPRDRPLPARLRQHALPLRRHAPQRRAVRARARHDRPDGRPEDREGRRRRLRLGRADRRHRRRALARALQGPRLGERLPHRNQAAGRQPLPPEAELHWWYQYYFATERGRAGYDDRREFAS